MREAADKTDGGSLPGWPFALLRIGVGVMFFRAGVDKVTRGEAWHDSVAMWIERHFDQAFGFYRGFLEHVALPHHGLFAELVRWGELMLGVALILGLATRYAAVAGAVMMLNFWFAKAKEEPFWSASNYDALLILILLALAISSAGRVLGLDQHFARRWPWLHL